MLPDYSEINFGKETVLETADLYQRKQKPMAGFSFERILMDSYSKKSAHISEKPATLSDILNAMSGKPGEYVF